MNEIQEIISQLDSLTSALFPRRIVDWGNDLHRAINGVTKEYLSDNGLEYHSWFVSDVNGRKVFSFEQSFKKDNRSASWNNIGTMSSIKWIAVSPFDKAESIKDGARYFDKIEMERRIEMARDWVKNSADKLAEAETELSNLENQYSKNFSV